MAFPVFVVLLLFAAVNFNPRTHRHTSGFMVEADRERTSHLPSGEETAGMLEVGSGDALTTGTPGFTESADELTARRHG